LHQGNHNHKQGNEKMQTITVPVRKVDFRYDWIYSTERCEEFPTATRVKKMLNDRAISNVCGVVDGKEMPVVAVEGKNVVLRVSQ
jgi:hypothetical protein